MLPFSLQILLNVRLIFHFAKIKESNTRNKKGMNFRFIFNKFDNISLEPLMHMMRHDSPFA